LRFCQLRSRAVLRALHVMLLFVTCIWCIKIADMQRAAAGT
jgi:hypothetical protein